MITHSNSYVGNLRCCDFAYSAFACWQMGMSGSASFRAASSQRGTRSLHAARIRYSLRPVERIAIKVLQIRTSQHIRATRFVANPLENLYCLAIVGGIHLPRSAGLSERFSQQEMCACLLYREVELLGVIESTIQYRSRFRLLVHSHKSLRQIHRDLYRQRFKPDRLCFFKQLL